MIGSLGFQELLGIALVLALFFGIGRLPSVLKDLGNGIREFKKGIRGGD